MAFFLFFFCFCLRIQIFCTGSGARKMVGTPHTCLLPGQPQSGESCTFAQPWGRARPCGGAAAPRCVRESNALHWDLGCCWQTRRRTQRMQPDNSLLTAQLAFPSSANYSKQSWQKFKLLNLSREMPFPFSFPHRAPPADPVHPRAQTCPW